jgi:hypothetical protein
MLSVLRIEQFAAEDSDREPRYLVDHYPEVLEAAWERTLYDLSNNVLRVGADAATEMPLEAGRFVFHACRRTRPNASMPIDYLYLLSYEQALATCMALLVSPALEINRSAECAPMLLSRMEAMRSGRCVGSQLAVAFRHGRISRSTLRHLFFHKSKDDARGLYLDLIRRTREKEKG